MPRATQHFELTGVAEMMRTLEEADEKLASRALSAALRKSAPLVVNDAKRLASKETGALRESITFVVRGRKTARYAIIGPEKGAVYQTPKGRRMPSRYAHLVEHGHSGTVAANPFLRPAVDANRERVVEAMAAEIRKHLERAVKRGKVAPQ